MEAKHPGALESQWIPVDEALWRVDRFEDFLEARKELLAAEANRRFAELLHGDIKWIAESRRPSAPVATLAVVGGVTSEEEEAELVEINAWVREHGLPEGIVSYDYADLETGEQIALFDLAWPIGLQEGLSEPVVVLLNEGETTIAIASAAGFRCFTSAAAFKDYVHREVLADLAA